MSKSNKRAKQELIRLYGAQCFIDKLHLRPITREERYTGKSQYKKMTKSHKKRMQELTFHHIREKSKGGKATVENGALLSADNHAWFHKQSKQDQRRMNEAFQEYKSSFDIHCAELIFTDKSIEAQVLEPDEEIDIELPPEIEAGIIEVEPMTPEEQIKYEEYLKQRRNKTFKRFGYNESLDNKVNRPKATIDEEWQKEIMNDVLDELRY